MVLGMAARTVRARRKVSKEERQRVTSGQLPGSAPCWRRIERFENLAPASMFFYCVCACVCMCTVLSHIRWARAYKFSWPLMAGILGGQSVLYAKAVVELVKVRWSFLSCCFFSELLLLSTQPDDSPRPHSFSALPFLFFLSRRPLRAIPRPGAISPPTA